MDVIECDVVIVGGGLAGLSLAVALAGSRLSVGLVEKRPPAPVSGLDTRVYAISPANARFLDEIGVWQHLDRSRLAAVQRMEIHGDAGGRLDFSAYDSGVDRLAWIIEASQIQNELWENAKRQARLALLCPAEPEALIREGKRAELTLSDGRRLRARLVVASDGADSWVRQAAGIDVEFSSYEQMGVVANFRSQDLHQNTAYQWFRNDGILAYLPLAQDDTISIVWSTGNDHAVELLAQPADEFSRRVAEAGEMRLGQLSLLTAPTGFPLRLMRAPKVVAPRLALIGDAAHVIHPLSGHGVNLGFQDAHVLSRTLAECPHYVDCGDERWLRRYERARAEDITAVQFATHGLQRLFRGNSATLSMIRNAGLNLTNALPVIRESLARYAQR